MAALMLRTTSSSVPTPPTPAENRAPRQGWPGAVGGGSMATGEGRGAQRPSATLPLGSKAGATAFPDDLDPRGLAAAAPLARRPVGLARRRSGCRRPAGFARRRSPPLLADCRAGERERRVIEKRDE
uniref:Uncharacterized protein n=1 Tax=Oryza sativa subsp. japonica TaxID=39947 RepID=Q69LC5_ORYSJ|nr:hypothetical protein [Oryza sativa Japonica Group]BAD31798.1 hypothetical protein [Oryza sativa Japonica Group]